MYFEKEANIQAEKIFTEARKELFFPPVKLRVVEGDKIRLNFAGKYLKPEVEIGKELVLILSENALKGLFQLSLGRWLKHPYSLKNAIMEIFWLRNFENADRIINMFDDVVVSIYLAKLGCKNVVDAFVELPCRDKADIILRLLLEDITGLKFASSIPSDKKREINPEIINKLKEINYSSENLHTLEQNILKFAKIINEFIESKEEEVLELNVNKIEKAMNEIAGEVGIKDFKDVSEYFGSGRGKGDVRKADIEWYLSRSSRYTIKIQDKVGGGGFPEEIVDYNFDDDSEFYSPIESLGKFIPGMAKMYRLNEFEGLGNKTRNAVIVLDSSGSMKSPERGSCAILGAFAIARKYMDSGGKVGVINFSWKTECLPPQRSYHVYEALASYQGGGTEINANEVIKFVKSYAVGYDIILITDAGIENIEDVTGMLKKLKDLSCKVYFIWIHSESKDFVEKKCMLEKLAELITVKNEEDIPNVVIGFKN